MTAQAPLFGSFSHLLHSATFMHRVFKHVSQLEAMQDGGGAGGQMARSAQPPWLLTDHNVAIKRATDLHQLFVKRWSKVTSRAEKPSSRLPRLLLLIRKAEWRADGRPVALVCVSPPAKK